MMVLHRIALPFINALFITACLFGLMYSLIYTGEPDLNHRSELFNFTPVAVPEDSEVEVITQKPSRPDEVVLQPRTIQDFSIIDIEQPDPGPWIDQKIAFSGGGLSIPTDAQLTIAMGYQPTYPSRAAARSIEGYVVVGFSVSPAGEVYDEYILESEPSGTFDRSALKAIKKFKYRARTVDGKPVSTDGQRYMFTYKLDS